VKIDTPAESLLDGDDLALARTNQALESMSAQERVCWAMQKLPAQQVVTSSFGGDVTPAYLDQGRDTILTC
jgi:hypothetical protein